MPLLPFFNSDGDRFLLVLVLVYAIVAVSLTVLVGWAGQVSLGHFALVGVGAYMVVRLGPHNWTFLGMTLFAGTVGAVVMVIVGLPALRIRGQALAVSTLALAVAAPAWLYGQSWFGQATDFGNQVNPILLGRGVGTPESELSLYMVALGLLILVMLAAAGLRRSAPGRRVMAVRDNERAAAAFGINPSAVKLAALATSGFIAATAGVIWADAWHVVSTAPVRTRAFHRHYRPPGPGWPGIAGRSCRRGLPHLSSDLFSRHASIGNIRGWDAGNRFRPQRGRDRTDRHPVGEPGWNCG